MGIYVVREARREQNRRPQKSSALSHFPVSEEDIQQTLWRPGSRGGIGVQVVTSSVIYPPPHRSVGWVNTYMVCGCQVHCIPSIEETAKISSPVAPSVTSRK